MTKKRITYAALFLAVIAELFLIFIIYLNPQKMAPIYDPSLQMWVNAGFNSLSLLALSFAYFFIKKKEIKRHIISIHLALLFSSLFLINYTLYHLSIGHVTFNNSAVRPLYLSILITHLLASFIALPLIFQSYAYAIAGFLKEHKKIAKWTFALWWYVSFTGILIVLFLKFLHQEAL